MAWCGIVRTLSSLPSQDIWLGLGGGDGIDVLLVIYQHIDWIARERTTYNVFHGAHRTLNISIFLCAARY